MFLLLLMLCYLLPGKRVNKLYVFSSLVMFSIGYGAIIGFEKILMHFNTIGASGIGRINTYISSLPLLMDHWFTGIGLESFSLLSPIYLKNFPENVHFDRVHNEYLEIFIELGVPCATILFIWLATLIVRIGLQLRRKPYGESSGGQYSTIIAIGIYCAIIGFLFHGLADFGWRLPANLIYATTLSALLTFKLKTAMDKDEDERLFKRKSQL